MKKLDIFGQSVKLTFRKESKFKTVIGGVASIFFFTILVTLLSIKTVDFRNIENSQIQISNGLLNNDVMDLFKL